MTVPVTRSTSAPCATSTTRRPRDAARRRAPSRGRAGRGTRGAPMRATPRAGSR